MKFERPYGWQAVGRPEPLPGQVTVNFSEPNLKLNEIRHQNRVMFVRTVTGSEVDLSELGQLQRAPTDAAVQLCILAKNQNPLTFFRLTHNR